MEFSVYKIAGEMHFAGKASDFMKPETRTDTLKLLF